MAQYSPPPRRVSRDLDAKLRAAAVRLTGEAGEVITPGRVLDVAASRAIDSLTADDVRRRPAPRARKAA